jgi:pimeloyl-ACP methyl ester carboxylesterase
MINSKFFNFNSFMNFNRADLVLQGIDLIQQPQIQIADVNTYTAWAQRGNEVSGSAACEEKWIREIGSVSRFASAEAAEQSLRDYVNKCMGNSAGGYVAQQLALQHPSLVKTLSLFGATPGLKNSHATTWIPKIKEIGLKKFLADTIYERFDETADPQLVAWFIEQAGSNDPAFIARFVLHMCTHDFMEELSAIKCPTLIVAAGRESIGHANAYEEMQKRIKGSELVRVDTAAHNICDGYPDLCVDHLMKFLAKHP